jgi:hypothetical protein
MDYNSVGAQKSFDVIPDGTTVVVQMNIRPGNAGKDGLLKRSKSREAEMLDAEFIVVEGDYAKRKFWENMVVDGATDGHKEAADITHRRLRAIIESVKGIKPADVSEAAKAARNVEYAEFDGMRFLCRVGVEPAHDGYKAKNTLAQVITPDRTKEWRPIEQAPKPPNGPSNAPTPIIKPKWATS